MFKDRTGTVKSEKELQHRKERRDCDCRAITIPFSRVIAAQQLIGLIIKAIYH